MATCPHADSLIPLLHDNELQSPLRREIVTHMATCVICARTLSLLEREQELFTQVIEQRVDSIDFSGFWQTVETKLSEPAPSRAVRLRWWYESWRPTWAFPVPAWAVATLLLSFVLMQLSLNNNFSLFPPKLEEERKASSISPSPEPQKGTMPSSPEEWHPAPILTSDSDPPNNLGDNQAQIESIYSSGSGAVVIHVHHDHESNVTVISYGDGAGESPQ